MEPYEKTKADLCRLLVVAHTGAPDPEDPIVTELGEWMRAQAGPEKIARWYRIFVEGQAPEDLPPGAG
jgi:hypothetical protein